jgi:Astacin (Peptidase family M12A)
MHSLGYEHEQTRYDRDMYVRVEWKNINPNYTHNFDKHPRTLAFPKYELDFSSLMMYGLGDFGMNGTAAMVVLVSSFQVFWSVFISELIFHCNRKTLLV